jgi:Na+-driven multidrug efflux pump
MGAGMGTAIAQMLGASIAIVALVNGRAGLRLPLRIPTLNMTIISTIARLGLPSSFQMLVVSVSRAFFFSVANIFGTSAIAAYTLGLKVDFLVFMPIFAFATAIEIITGQHLGAKKVKRIFEFYRAGLLQLGAVIVTLGALAYIFAPNIASIFTDDADVIAATVGYLRVAVFGYPLFLFGVYSVRLMSGAGATVRSMIITAGNVAFLQAPLVIMLSQWTSLHETGIWLGILIGYAGMATFGYINVMGKKWITARV